MTAMKPVAKDSPLMKAWEAYKLTDDYANTRKWAKHDEHVDGSLWAAFMQGFLSAAPINESAAEHPAKERSEDDLLRSAAHPAPSLEVPEEATPNNLKWIHVKIGKYYIGRHPAGGYWIEHESGEGMEAGERFEEAVDEFYKNNF